MKKRIGICCSYALVLIPLSAYHFLYFNMYFPITEGWFSTYGHLIRSGQVPYRDFFLLLPPLYPYQIAAFQTLFGESLISLRYLGLFTTCAIGVVLFEILRALFNRWVTAFVACIALIYYQSGNAFIGYDFTQFLTLYLLMGTMFLMRYCTKMMAANGSTRTYLLFLCGVFLALAALIKHSNGVLGALAVLIAAVIVVSRYEARRDLTKRFLSLGGGFAAPFVLLFLWLLYKGMLSDFISNVFLGALQAKGGSHAVLVHWFAGFIAGGYAFHTLNLLKRLLLLVSFIVALSSFLGIMLAIRRNGLGRWKEGLSLNLIRSGTQEPRLGRSGLVSLLFGFVCLLAIIFSIYYGIPVPPAMSNMGTLVRNQIILGATNLYVIGAVIAVLFVACQTKTAAANYLIVFALGIGLTIGNGSSGGLSEISAFLGLSVAVAYLLAIASRYAIPLLIPVSIFLSFVAVLVNDKFSVPYHWWAVTSSDIRTVTCAPTEGILEGLCIDPPKKSKIDEIVDEVRRLTHETDQIYIFPHIPVFYLLTGRPPYSKAPVSWFDFMSDDQAIYLSNQLVTHPPPLLIVTDLPEVVLATHERLFRAGNSLGQREILRSIQTLENNHVITKIKTVTNLDGLEIVIYVKVNNSDARYGQP